MLSMSNSLSQDSQSSQMTTNAEIRSPTLGEVKASIRVRFLHLVRRSFDINCRIWFTSSLPLHKHLKNFLVGVLFCLTARNWWRLSTEKRYATFKLEYYPHTPDDYEPPLFVAGGDDRRKMVFSTHDINEPPFRVNIGKVETGFNKCDFIRS